MKYYRAIHYTHASLDGKKTLCGMLIMRTQVNISLWTEVENINETLRGLCRKCKKHPDMYRHFEVTGQQLTLTGEKNNEKS